MKNLNQLKELKKNLNDFGEIKKVVSSIGNSWQHYSVHIIELTLSLLSLFKQYNSISKIKIDDENIVTLMWKNGPEVTLITRGQKKTNCTIEIWGTKKTKKIIFEDYYDAFENTLELFCKNIRNKKNITKKEELDMIVKIIQFGSS